MPEHTCRELISEAKAKAREIQKAIYNTIRPQIVENHNAFMAARQNAMAQCEQCKAEAVE